MRSVAQSSLSRAVPLDSASRALAHTRMASSLAGPPGALEKLASSEVGPVELSILCGPTVNALLHLLLLLSASIYFGVLRCLLLADITPAELPSPALHRLPPPSTRFRSVVRDLQACSEIPPKTPSFHHSACQSII